MRGHRSWAAAALFVLVFVSLARPAAAQTHSEPVDLEATVGEIRGPVPYAPGDGRDRAYSSFHDELWRTRALPGLFRAAGDDQDIGWYRIHLRVREWPREQLAVALPPIYGGWQLWFNGRLLDGSGDLDAAVSSWPRSGDVEARRSRGYSVPVYGIRVYATYPPRGCRLRSPE